MFPLTVVDKTVCREVLPADDGGQGAWSPVLPRPAHERLPTLSDLTIFGKSVHTSILVGVATSTDHTSFPHGKQNAKRRLENREKRSALPRTLADIQVPRWRM